jgi:hypothetical protein
VAPGGQCLAEPGGHDPGGDSVARLRVQGRAVVWDCPLHRDRVPYEPQLPRAGTRRDPRSPQRAGHATPAGA